MKKYYFVNFTVHIDNGQSPNHMSVLATDKAFFPILSAKNRISEVFKEDIWSDLQVVIHNFQEVSEECSREFHQGDNSLFGDV